jgi:hypothetical protein
LDQRDIFKPLIGDQTIKGAKSKPGEVNGWSYIGSVSVDNVPFALLQKSGTGDSGYYRVGETLEGMKIQSILPNQIVLGEQNQPPIQLPITSGVASSASSSQRSGNARNQPGGQTQNAANGNGVVASNDPNAPQGGPAAASANEAQYNNGGPQNFRNFGGGGFPGGGFRGGGRFGGGQGGGRRRGGFQRGGGG